MQTLRRYLLLTMVLMLTATRLMAQTPVCNGSLGDPVVNEDFGSNGVQSNISAQTDFERAQCPEGGYYDLVTRVTGCHDDNWHQVLTDHTGNSGGYMMLVNADPSPSAFFTKTIDNLCPGTVYQFSAYILNLMKKSVGGAYQPKLVFTIEDINGNLLVPARETGTILPTDSPVWIKDSLLFKTKPDQDKIVLRIRNDEGGQFGNDLVLDDIVFRACGPTVVTEFDAFTGKLQQMCEGESNTYTLKATVNDPTYDAYQWQVNTGSDWSDIPNANSKTLVLSFASQAPGNYSYRLGVAQNGNIGSLKCRVYSSGDHVIRVNPLPVIPAVAPMVLCEGDNLTINVSGGTKYYYTGPDGFTQVRQGSLTKANVKPEDSGTYYVVAESDNGCISKSPLAVQVTVKPKLLPTTTGGLPICRGESTMLTATGGEKYLWSPATGLDDPTSATPIASPLQTTNYTVRVSNGACFIDMPPIPVIVYQLPLAIAPLNKSVFEGESVVLDARARGDNVTYSWFPVTYLDDPTKLNPVASPTEDITYTLTVTSASCSFSISDPVSVHVYKNVIFSNTFSPNGDGVNDVWLLKELNTYTASQIIIFDRAGQEVFRSTGYSRPWDGTHNGTAMPAGTYYYILDLKIGRPKVKGWVTILR